MKLLKKSDKGMGADEFELPDPTGTKAAVEIPLSPFRCPIPLKRLTRREFDGLSHKIMAHVFASQNELGRLCDEAVYRNDLALRLQAVGLGPVAMEVPLSVSLRDFTKTYRLDLVVQESFIIELKTAVALTNEHNSQLLNYLLIAGMPHGKLVNLRPASVEYRTVNAVVSAAERRRFHLETERWRPQSSRCRFLPEILAEMFTVWGAFLDCHLYEEAVIYFFGGEGSVLRSVPLQRDGAVLGAQTIPLMTDSVAFRLTALPPEARDGFETHLRRFLALTPLAVLHWVNLHHHEIQLATIRR